MPWSECGDAERLDVHNGLLLSALWDAAFDEGFVIFADDGTPIASSRLGELGGAAGTRAWTPPRRSTTSATGSDSFWHGTMRTCFKRDQSAVPLMVRAVELLFLRPLHYESA